LNNESEDLTTPSNNNNLRKNLYTIHKLFLEKFDNNYAPTSQEYEFCLNALDYLKGLSLSFHASSLLIKYNNLILKMNLK